MIKAEDIKKYTDEFKDIRKKVKKVSNKNNVINNLETRNSIQNLSQDWFDRVRGELEFVGISGDVLASIDNKKTHLLKISSTGGNKKDAYLSDLNFVIKELDKIKLNVQTQSGGGSVLSRLLADLLADIHDSDQNIFIKEAMDCAVNNCFKSSVAMGWCAAIDHIHNKIEDMGFELFNSACININGFKKGRFKNFNKIYSVSSLSEIREIFDKDILWIIEGMGLIDLNQHTRLKSCFDMRNQSAHPGEALINEYNLISFFSDLKEIIFNNSKFLISKNNN